MDTSCVFNASLTLRIERQIIKTTSMREGIYEITIVSIYLFLIYIFIIGVCSKCKK